MHLRRFAFGTLVLGAVFLNTGCIIIHDGGWNWGSSVWTEEVQERIALDATGLQKIEVKTHNGVVNFQADSGEAYVIARKKAGACSEEEAQKALEALEVVVESAGPGTQRLGYRFDGIKGVSWNASVAFEIHAPANIDLVGQTHNGGVTVAGLQGNLDFRTHNGGVKAETTGDSFLARTHNGKIEATFSGKELKLETHNGSVKADLTACASVDGSIKTHNGSVEILVGEATSANLDCHTYNGGISCSAPLNSVETGQRTLHGTLGGGDGNLAVQTHNGSVRVKDSAG